MLFGLLFSASRQAIARYIEMESLPDAQCLPSTRSTRSNKPAMKFRYLPCVLSLERFTEAFSSNSARNSEIRRKRSPGTCDDARIV